jgi:hypothetical protein
MSECIRLVISNDAPSTWTVRGLEHDVAARGQTIGKALRAAVNFIEAHTAFDRRHGHLPLSVFPPSPQRYWNAFDAGTVVSLTELGIGMPEGWDVQAVLTVRRPWEGARHTFGGTTNRRYESARGPDIV